MACPLYWGPLKMPGAWLPSATFSWPRGKLRKCRLPPRLPSLLALCSSFLQTASHPQSSLRRGSHWYLSSCIVPKFWKHLSTCQVFSSPLSRLSSQDSAAEHIPSWRLRHPVLLREDNFNLYESFPQGPFSLCVHACVCILDSERNQFDHLLVKLCGDVSRTFFVNAEGDNSQLWSLDLKLNF